MQILLVKFLQCAEYKVYRVRHPSKPKEGKFMFKEMLKIAGGVLLAMLIVHFLPTTVQTYFK